MTFASSSTAPHGRVLVAAGFVLSMIAGCTGDTCGDAVIDDGESCDGTVFPEGQTCQTEGFRGGELRCTPGCTLDVSGCGAPVLAVTAGFDNQDAPCAADGVTDCALDLGLVSVGQSAVGRLELENQGNAEMQIEGLRISDDSDPAFSIDTDGITFIPSQGAVSVQLSFTPTVIAVVSGTLLVDTDADNADVVEVALQGRGTPP